MNFLDKYNELINKDIYISKNMIDNLLYNENLNIDLTDLEVYANIGKTIDKHNCDFLNNKRLIYVKNIYPKGAIFSLPMLM